MSGRITNASYMVTVMMQDYTRQPPILSHLIGGTHRWTTHIMPLTSSQLMEGMEFIKGPFLTVPRQQE